jgi:WD40 repeat protein
MVWSPGSWTCDRTLVGADDGAVNALVECRGRLASAGDDGVIKLWSSHTWACEVTVHHTIHDEEGVESAAQVGVMSLEVCDDKLVSGGDDSIIRIWNTNSWTCERIISAHHDEVWAIFMTPMGSLITGSVDSTIRLWHQQVINPGNRTLNGHQLTRVSTPVLSHSSSLVTNSSGINSSYTVAGDDRSNNGGEEPSVDWICDQTIQSDGPVYALCCLDNFVVSAGSGSKISVWRSNGEGPSIEQLTLHKWFDTTETGIWSLAVAKGKLISGSVDGNIRVWT